MVRIRDKGELASDEYLPRYCGALKRLSGLSDGRWERGIVRKWKF